MNTWLPIKSEYIVENFDSLLEYLYNADFDRKDDKFLAETIEKLEEVATSVMEENFSHKLGIKDLIDETWIRNQKIVAASIYASFKSGKDFRKLLVRLIDNYIINQIVCDESSFKKIKAILVGLANNAQFQLPYSLRDLMSDDFAPKEFANKLLGMRFDNPASDTLTYETKGQCVFKNNNIEIITKTSSDCKKAKIKSVADVGLDVNILTDGKKRVEDLDFQEQDAELSHLLNTLYHNQPAKAPKLKRYTEDDVFFVEVISMDRAGRKIICRTLDPAYEAVELELLIPQYHPFNPWVSVQREDFINHLEIEQKLKVKFFKKNNTIYFSFEDQLNEYYFDLEYLDESKAIYVKDYGNGKGTTWLTANGRWVNIQKNQYDEEINEAASNESDYGINICFKFKTLDKSGNTIINASRVGSLVKDVDRDQFIEEAIRNMVGDIYNYWDSECPEYEDKTVAVNHLPDYYAETLTHLLAMRGEDMELTHSERYITTAAAKALAIILDRDHDSRFCDYNLKFLRALWAFAEDPENRWLKEAEEPEALENIDIVNQKNEVLKILSNYKSENTAKPSLGNSLDVERVSQLVEASNTLIGNITSTEINRIKRTISKCLGIESLHKEDHSGKHWFGDESDMLEFKTSIVFVPKKKGEPESAEPNVQIWQILKTINGFLNSLYGGTLLLGVNDSGYANGIEADIKWLRKNNIIFVDNVDHYIQYLKLRVDNAFEAYNRKMDKGRDIVSTRVKYSHFQSDGHIILRIDIQPYEMGCVKLRDSIDIMGKEAIKRPDFIKDAYRRNSITTEELTNKIRKQVEIDKRNIINDKEKQSPIAVQQAIDTKKLIRLENYQSSSSVSSRTITPVELLPLRGLVVGIEKGQKDVKIFKLNRCESVVVLDESCNPPAKKNYQVDPFNMLAPSSSKQFDVHLKLNRQAWLLLKETYPYTEDLITDEKVGQYPFSLKCQISKVEGIGSFCMSTLGCFEIVEGEELKRYIKDKCSTVLS